VGAALEVVAARHQRGEFVAAFDNQRSVLVEKIEKFAFARHEATEHRDLDWKKELLVVGGVGSRCNTRLFDAEL